MEFVSGCKERIFVNPGLGCPSECSYCYLPFKGLSVGEAIQNTKSSGLLIEDVLNSDLFMVGKAGSIISIGCFTECWDASTREITKELIVYFLEQGNPVQFATKRYVNAENIKHLVESVKYKGQLTVFVSCATINAANIYEKGTTHPKKRLSCIKKLETLGIPAYLYIKPVIQAVTINDIEEFKYYAEGRCSGVIVGSQFIEKSDALGSNPLLVDGLIVKEAGDECEIKQQLGLVATVYSQSIDAVNYWRNLSE